MVNRSDYKDALGRVDRDIRICIKYLEGLMEEKFKLLYANPCILIKLFQGLFVFLSIHIITNFMTSNISAYLLLTCTPQFMILDLVYSSVNLRPLVSNWLS